MLRRFGAIIRPYPKALKIPLALLIAEAAVLIGKAGTANAFLELAAAAGPDPSQQAQLGYIAGLVKELSGDVDGAVAEWETVKDGPDRRSRALAAAARAELLLKNDGMEPAEVIEVLESLRFAWRGGEFEFDLLRRLGELYLDVGDYRRGLYTLRQAVTYFSTHEKAPEVHQKMAESFAKLFLEDAADTLAPVTAIALYDEFKELTPAGKRGDDLVRKLAERLVDIDLLGRAAKLLQAQIEFRLQGVEKASAGTQLARVHLLDRAPEKTLKVLERTAVPDMPEEMLARRRLLTARALRVLDRTPEALAALKDDKSIEADDLRVEFYWADQDWSNTARVLRRLARAAGAKPDEPLDDRQSKFILNLATTLTLSGNQRAINRLRKDYGAAMDEGLFRDAFRLIAGAQALGLIDPASMGEKVGQAEDFQGFMSAYRDRLKNEGAGEPEGSPGGG